MLVFLWYFAKVPGQVKVGVSAVLKSGLEAEFLFPSAYEAIQLSTVDSISSRILFHTTN